jgi:hypothetical protein
MTMSGSLAPHRKPDPRSGLSASESSLDDVAAKLADVALID